MISKNFKKRFYTSLFLLFLLILVFRSNLILTFMLLIFGSLSVVEFFSITRIILKNIFFKFITNFIFLIYTFLFCYLFFVFIYFPNLKTIIFIILLGCISSDIGGYIFGKILKGPKLTKVSPKKTISGSVGSFILSGIVMTFLINYFTNNFTLNIIFISLITSAFCQLGDLFFSFLKRKAKVKDYGNYLPGHGGMLDRFDGIFLGVPIGVITFILVLQ